MGATRRSTKPNKTILVLEAPWGLDDKDINRSSVQPFVDGIAKLQSNITVHYTRFYDLNSFRLALDELTQATSSNTIVYIAAHGYKSQIHSTSIRKILDAIGEKSKERPEANITGVMIGSCYVGGNTFTMEAYIEDTNLAWCCGYASSVEWFTGTLIDISVIGCMLSLNEQRLSNGKTMTESLKGAIAPFNQDYIIGEDYDGDDVKLKDSIKLVIQPRGQGKRARDITADVVAS